MPFIKLRNGKMLSVAAIKSHEKSIHEIHKEIIEPGYAINKITRLPSKQETVLTLTLMDDKTEKLYGKDAEDALAVPEDRAP